MTNITATSQEDQYTYLIISRSGLLRVRNVSDQHCRENQNTHFYVQYIFFLNRTFYDISWKNMVEPDRRRMRIWRTLILCLIPKDTNTHSEYVTLIPSGLQRCLHERTSILPYMYTACFVTESVLSFPTYFTVRVVFCIALKWISLLRTWLIIANITQHNLQSFSLSLNKYEY